MMTAVLLVVAAVSCVAGLGAPPCARAAAQQASAASLVRPSGCGDAAGAVYGAWFEMILSHSGTVMLDTCSTEWDTVIQVEQLNTCLAQNDNASTCAHPAASRVQFEGVAGSTYDILVRTSGWHAGVHEHARIATAALLHPQRRRIQCDQFFQHPFAGVLIPGEHTVGNCQPDTCRCVPVPLLGFHWHLLLVPPAQLQCYQEVPGLYSRHWSHTSAGDRACSH
eukprot:TRINITY_DN17106_c0_g1_i1.p1 TRINITY_DN17106_c0_g1~~TRINITY_DN17106_c0_g1_i1.p1  ORF type:complete len:223 (+),score=26.23 TRINITY_DN17106_c0_g1_i1:59-727(+)